MSMILNDIYDKGRATPRSRNLGVDVGVDSRSTPDFDSNNFQIYSATPTLKFFKSTPDTDSKYSYSHIVWDFDSRFTFLLFVGFYYFA